MNKLTNVIHIGPSREEMQPMIAKRKVMATYTKGEGYWAKQTANELQHAGEGYYTVQIGNLGHAGSRAPGIIYRRPATSGKWSKSAATRLGAPIPPCIDLGPDSLRALLMSGREITVKAPRGYAFGQDNIGLFLARKSKGDVWHFGVSQLTGEGGLIAAMRADLAVRDARAKEQRDQQRKWAAQKREADRINAIMEIVLRDRLFLPSAQCHPRRMASRNHRLHLSHEQGLGTPNT